MWGSFKMRYISIDTETGGIGLDKSLLSVAMLVADKDFNIVDSLELFVIPDDGVFRVSPDGLKINKIDLTRDDFIPYKKAGTVVYDFIKRNSLEGRDKLNVVGKQVNGDLNHIWDKLISRNTWEQFVSYRIIELTGIARYLQIAGKIPADVKGGMDSLLEYFGHSNDGAHDATFDANSNLVVLKEFLKLG